MLCTSMLAFSAGTKADLPQLSIRGGLSASPRLTPVAWVEQMGGVPIKVVHVKNWNEVMGWEMRNGRRPHIYGRK